MKPSAPLLFAVTFAATSVSVVHAGESGEDSRATSAESSTFNPDLRVSGTVRADYFRSSKNLDGEIDFFGATTQIKALTRFSESLTGKLELRVANPGLGKDEGTRGRLLEGYVTAHFDKADLRIGKQIVAWGRADGINPTDNLTPRNYAVMLPFEDDQRFGTTAVKLDAYLSQEYTFTAFATPYFESSQIPIPAAGFALVETKPAQSLSNTNVGMRLNKVGDGLDWSVSYYRGFSLLPEMQLTGITPVGPKVELNYGRIKAIGADFARNYGRFGLRAEVAYVDNADDPTLDPRTTRNPYLSWVAGLDRTFFDNLNVNLQFFQRRVRHYRSPETIADPLARSIAIQNAVLGGQRDRLNNGISFRVSNKWFNDTLEAELFSVVNLTRKDRLVRPLLSYAFNDRWKGTIGADLYRGAVDTQFGSLKSNRGTFAELRYGF